jgi:hypothetical protein
MSRIVPSVSAQQVFEVSKLPTCESINTFHNSSIKEYYWQTENVVSFQKRIKKADVIYDRIMIL